MTLLFICYVKWILSPFEARTQVRSGFACVRLLLTLGILVRSFLGLSDRKKAETFCLAEFASQATL